MFLDLINVVGEGSKRKQFGYERRESKPNKQKQHSLISWLEIGARLLPYITSPALLNGTMLEFEMA